MKADIAAIVADALERIPSLSGTSGDVPIRAIVERTRDPRHGDFATNVAMQLAKSVGMNPRNIAQSIVDALPENDMLESVEIAGPGFINFRVGAAAFHREVGAILAAGTAYGRGEAKTGPRILLEFVSANPTGPLHVGHGRHASFGATLGNLLEAAGYEVDREYYVNDAGRQMDVLAVSVILRAMEAAGQAIVFPAAGYRGDYVRDMVAEIDGTALPDPARLFENLPPDAPQGDKEAHIGALIDRAEALMGAEAYDRARRASFGTILNDIRGDLEEFGVTFDRWFSEQSLTDDRLIEAAIEVLRERRMLYQKDGATWFRATDFGDEKDRVVVRENGKSTYFASDIAYHFGKRQRGYEHLIDILGQDHHGYVARVRAGLEAMGYAGDSLEVPLVQFVTLYRGGEQMQMSTRSGEFITLRQLREEVGNDAARFFYVMRSNDQHLDFDLELAKSRSNDNPVYYIQYAHARVCSVFRQLGEKGFEYDRGAGLAALERLTESHEKTLMSSLSRYPEIVELGANNRAPHALVHYLRDLANDLHSYYNAHLFIVDDSILRNARLALIDATRTVISNGLCILGVSAPESM